MSSQLIQIGFIGVNIGGDKGAHCDPIKIALSNAFMATSEIPGIRLTC